MSLYDLLYILLGIPLTLALTFLSFAIGIVLGFVFLLIQTSKYRPFSLLITLTVIIVRALPPILWLFIIYFGLGSGFITVSPFLAAILTFGILSAVNITEIYRGALFAIPNGQWEVCKVLNFTATQTWLRVVIPQMFRVAIPSLTTYAIGLMKDSAIASVIGVMEMAYRGRLITQMTHEGLASFAVVGAGYMLLSLPLAQLSRFVEKKLKNKVAR